MQRFLTIAVAGLALSLSPATLEAGYKIRDLQVRAAKEYTAFQDFQNIVIAAEPHTTEEATKQLFDTDKLYKKSILPVLVLIENNNDFAIRVFAKDIVLLGPDGAASYPIPHHEVLLHITLKESARSYSTSPEAMAKKVVDQDMLMDFEHKSFTEKLIGPHSTDFGVVFYWATQDLEQSRLYIPEIVNVTESEELMFFEFDLGRTEE